MTYKVSDDDFKSSIEKSNNIGEALKNMGYTTASQNYRMFNKRVKQLNIDISHFNAKRWERNKFIKKPIEEFLQKNRCVNSSNLKKRLINEGFLENKCYECNITDWQNKKLVMHLEHKDGDPLNNELSNLTLLCPNCHSQTSTYCRGQKRKKHTKNKRNKPRFHLRKVERPPLEVLEQDVKILGYLGTGRKYKVSDNAIRKWIKYYKNSP